MAKLTPRQARFVEEYLIDLNATQAAIRAGYSEKGATVRGSELLANRNVSEAVAEKRSAQQKRTQITQDMGIEGLLSNINRASEAEAVTDRDGNQIGIVYQGSVVNKGWELLGKHLGMFTDKMEHSGSITSRVYSYGSAGSPAEPDRALDTPESDGDD